MKTSAILFLTFANMMEHIDSSFLEAQLRLLGVPHHVEAGGRFAGDASKMHLSHISSEPSWWVGHLTT